MNYRHQIDYELYEDWHELQESDVSLIEQAYAFCEQAYAPYSQFKVGAVLLLEDGSVVKGNNQENMAYPSGLCAERVALFYAGANFPTIPIKILAVTAFAKSYEVNQPVMPCGACLQSISEFELRFSKPIQIILQGNSGPIYIAEGTKTFLPFQFFIKELGM